MSRFIKTIGICLGAGLLGVLLSIPPLSLDLEEQLGLKLLFHIRGPRHPPPEVVVVSMDRESIEVLNLPAKIQEWPRELHSQLVQEIASQGTKLIVFDLLFDAPSDENADETFASVVAGSRNVVLCESIQQERIPITDSDGNYLANLNIETLVPPIPSLARSALALAPFPLPLVPIQVSQFWIFKTSAGNSPTLPVVAFFVYVSDQYETFYQLLTHVRPESGAVVLPTWEQVVDRRGVEDSLIAIREIFSREPSVADEMTRQLESPGIRVQDPLEHDRLRSLIGLFRGKTSRYLNFYGPAGTIDTRSYHKVLMGSGATHQTGPALKSGLEGKVVFVGLSENFRPQRQDGYHTVFSQKNGIDISGVEIAATAFANLLEDRMLRPLEWPMHVLIVFVFGSLLGLVCFSLPMGVATVSVIGAGSAYLVLATVSFNVHTIWLPVVIPLFMLVPLALIGTVACRYCVATKEREVIRKAFGYFLPDPVIDQLSKNLGNVDATNQVLYGICLYTDAQQYAALSESLDPKALSRFMNRYYERLFVPVRRHGGIVSDVMGDSMMAIWAKSTPDASLRAAACHAALGIVEAIRVFNRENPTIRLHTRLGMHAGHILVGNIGAVDHYEYRPVGDIVNTASRMEGMNKYLGTQILVSEQVLQRVDGLMTRCLGTFLPFGKSNPVVIHELLAYAEDSDIEQQRLCNRFEAGLRAYRNRHWDEAIQAFEETLTIYRADGPSIFYKKRCEGFKQHPPDETWDGTIVMGQK